MNSAYSDTRTQSSSSTTVKVISLAVVPKEGFSRDTTKVTFPLYWIEAEFPTFQSLEELLADTEFGAALTDILIDPLLEELWFAQPSGHDQWVKDWRKADFTWFAERQFLPGVTDNLARTVEEALQMRGLSATVASGTGVLYKTEHFEEAPSADLITEQSRYVLFHPLTDRFVVHELGNESETFLTFPEVHLGQAEPVKVVALDLDDEGLIALSQERLLALNLEEMRAIRNYFSGESVRSTRRSRQLPEWPTDVELEVIAQTWSEHCKHKIFNATINYADKTAGTEECIRSLYKSYIQKPTMEMRDQRTDLLSVFEDNSGVVRWNNEWALCFKVETHNSPSALEPYGGALTGILGVNRDILGTGLGAKPIFNTDVFCFAYPSDDLPDRPKLLPAKTILSGVRRGVQDGGNKSGIPTLNGAIFFHPGYRAKPLVFCGTGGLLPTTVHKKTGFKKHTQIGDTIVMIGGRVGKDGIHGATFSSEALHEGSPVSAVQIGDPFTQKRVLDFVVEARDRGLITGITDNGAGGLSSSVGEMATITNGATIELDNIPLKYPGLADYEIVISESQERMTISTRSFHELKRLAERYNVEATSIGAFHSKGYFEVTRAGRTVALLELDFLHDGLPPMVLEAEWVQPNLEETVGAEPGDLKQSLLDMLSHPNICSRESIIRQYDHEVQGNSVIKPLMGPLQQAPCDAAVFRALYEEDAAVVVSNGICPGLSRYDAHFMAIAAVDEAVRNAVAVGGDPSSLVLLDNFCWPDPIVSERNADGKYKLAQLVRTCQGLAEAVRVFKTPLISGKDSMKNDFDDGTIRLSIPPTLLVSAMGRMEQSDLAVSMEFKSCGDLIYVLNAGGLSFAGSQYAESNGWTTTQLPTFDLAKAADMYKRLHEAMTRSWVKSCHDVSDGGVAVAVAEGLIGSGLGAELSFAGLKAAASVNAPEQHAARRDFVLFAEGPSRFVISIQPELRHEWEELWRGFGCTMIGLVVQAPELIIKAEDAEAILDATVDELTSSWKTALPFD